MGEAGHASSSGVGHDVGHVEAAAAGVDAAIGVLRTVARRVGAAHHAAWWPGSGEPQYALGGGGRTRSGGAIPLPGDPRSFDRYGELLTDIRGLERDVRQVAPLAKNLPGLSVMSSARVVHQRLMLVIGVLASVRGEPLDDDDVRVLLKRATRVGQHVDAILSTPRRPDPQVLCRNPRERESCTRVVSNERRRLCRSCENHEDYRGRKRRRAV